MNKPLVYLDADLAISCFMRSLCAAGLVKQAEPLLGLTVSNSDDAHHARRIVDRLPSTATTEKTKRGALEMLSFASTQQMAASSIQAPID